jgi:hypothetical protein
MKIERHEAGLGTQVLLNLMKQLPLEKRFQNFGVFYWFLEMSVGQKEN